jgi:hypothetical protein
MYIKGKTGENNNKEGFELWRGRIPMTRIYVGSHFLLNQ